MAQGTFFSRLIDNLTGKSLDKKKQTQNKEVVAVKENIPNTNVANINQVQPEIPVSQSQTISPQNSALPVLNDTKPKAKRNFNFKKPLKIFGVFSAILVSCMTIFAIIYFSGVDTKIVSVNLKGFVYDDLATPIQSAKIEIGDKFVETNANGFFQISNLELGEQTIKITADEFDVLERNINITRGMFRYDNNLDFSLSPSNFGNLIGKLIVKDEAYDFKDSIIKIGADEYKIGLDGTFNIKRVPIGNTEFVFTSSSYRNIKRQISITKGRNVLQDIELSPSGTIVGNLVSYVKEDPVVGIQITVTNVPDENIMINERDNMFVISDLIVGNQYDIRIVAPGYETKEYSVNLKQGTNTLFDIKFVEAGTAVYTIREDRTDFLVRSDFDGSNMQKLFEIREFSPESTYLDHVNNTVFFLSDYERLASTLNRRVKLMYEYDLSTNAVRRVSNNYGSLNQVTPIYSANVLVNINPSGRNNAKTTVDITNYDGNLLSTGREIEGRTVRSVLVDDSLKYLVTLEENSNRERFLAVTNLSSRNSSEAFSSNSLELFDIDNQGNRILFTSTDTSTQFRTLYMFDTRTSEIRVLQNDARGQMYQFKKGSDDEIIYMDIRNQKSGIYMFRISNNVNTRLFEVRANEPISNFYQQGNYILYTSNNSLYITDYEKPIAYKLVR